MAYMTEAGGFLSKQHTDVLRGVSITAIIVCHAATQMLRFEIARLFTPLGGIGVAVFLLVSGYGLSITYERSLANYWRNRFSGAIALYLLVWVLTIPLKQYSSAAHVLLDLLTIKLQFPYFWYIGYLVVWYVVAYLVALAPISTRGKSILLVAVSVALFAVCDELRAEQSFSFVLGVFLHRYSDRLKRFVTANRTIIILMVVGICALSLKQLPLIRNSDRWIFVLVQVLIKVPIALFIVGSTYRLLRERLTERTLMAAGRVGRVSYELFLSHSITITLFEAPARGLGVRFLMFTVATAGLTVALYFINRSLRRLFVAHHRRTT